MNTRSAVQFSTDSRVHIGLAVRDLDRSLAFYRTLLDAEPSKIRPDYAKFEPEDPPVNLSLNVEPSASADRPRGGAHHYGVQVQSTDAVESAAQRLRAAGIATRSEESTTCCYAVQTKVWADDPDGNSWEVFVVLEADADRRSDTVSSCCVGPSPQATSSSESTDTPCCSGEAPNP